jgi:hypothetical protein
MNDQSNLTSLTGDRSIIIIAVFNISHHTVISHREQASAKRDIQILGLRFMKP